MVHLCFGCTGRRCNPCFGRRLYSKDKSVRDVSSPQIGVVSCREASYRINNQIIFFGRSADGYCYCKLVTMKRAVSHIVINPVKWPRLYPKGNTYVCVYLMNYKMLHLHQRTGVYRLSNKPCPGLVAQSLHMYMDVFQLHRDDSASRETNDSGTRPGSSRGQSCQCQRDREQNLHGDGTIWKRSGH